MNKLDIDRLIFIPSFFEDNPTLLKEVLEINPKEQKNICDDIGYNDNMRALYTKCNCKHDNDFYWFSKTVEGVEVEVFYCGKCQKWSMSVTY